MSLGTAGLSLRLRWAALRLRRGNYDGAQALYVSVINRAPAEVLLLTALAGSAEAEFWCGRFLNARYYAGQYLDRIEANPELGKGREGLAMVEKMRRYQVASGERHLQFGRRAFLEPQLTGQS